MIPRQTSALQSPTVIVDSHQHFWDPGVYEYPWMDQAPKSLQRRFWIDDLRPLLADAGVDRSVFVQTHSSVDETIAMLAVAASTDFLDGVVGWVDLTAPDVGTSYERLRSSATGRYLVGVRPQVEDESDPTWLLRDDVQRGLRALERSGAVFDLLVKPPNLRAAIETVRRLPGLQFVVDHAAKPPIRSGDARAWRDLVGQLAAAPNVACKLSGLVTEANWAQWTPSDLRPYVQFAVEQFGPERLMFGSDWPVCTVAASYAQVLEAVVDAIAELDEADRAWILGATATSIYHLGNA